MNALSDRVVNGASLLTSGNSTEFAYDGIEEAFPVIDAGMMPLGTLVLVQFRQPKNMSAGGIELPDEIRSTEHYNTQVAKVIAMGPLAFKTIYRGTDDRGIEVEEVRDWTGGAWYEPGNFVWVPKYGGDRFSRPASFKRMKYNHEARRAEPVTIKEDVLFAFYKAKDIHGRVTTDPLTLKAFLD